MNNRPLVAEMEKRTSGKLDVDFERFKIEYIAKKALRK